MAVKKTSKKRLSTKLKEARWKGAGFGSIRKGKKHDLMARKKLEELTARPFDPFGDTEKKPAKKRNGKTIIKARKVTILNLTKKKNPPRKANITSASDLAYAGTAKRVTQDGVKGWQLGSKFFPGSATTKAVKITSSAYLDLRTGDVWKRKAKGNPKERQSAASGKAAFDKARQMLSAGKSRADVAKYLRGVYYGTPAKTVMGWVDSLKTERKKNIAGFMQDGVFHPIRSGVEQRTVKGRKKLVKSKKAYKPSKVGEKRTYSAKKSAKRAAQSRRMTAATKQRKATTSRLAARSLQRSVPLKGKRRNPDTPAQLLEQFRGYPKDRDDSLRFPNGTPSGLYKLGALKKIVTTYNTINMPSNQVWLCADTKGKLYVGGLTKGAAKGRVVNAPAGSLGKVMRIEYLEKKPHLGDHNKTLYFHKMGEEDGIKPTLYSDGDGNLLFKGGNYSVTYRGIVN